jgi:hypothetical protein
MFSNDTFEKFYSLKRKNTGFKCKVFENKKQSFLFFPMFSKDPFGSFEKFFSKRKNNG